MGLADPALASVSSSWPQLRNGFSCPDLTFGLLGTKWTLLGMFNCVKSVRLRTVLAAFLILGVILTMAVPWKNTPEKIAIPLADAWSKPPPTGPNQIVGFYHFWYGENVSHLDYSMGILDDQLGQVLSSYTYNTSSSIYVNIVGNPNSSGQVVSKVRSKFPHAATKLYLAHQHTGFEDATLQKIYRHCVEHPENIVWYIHSKGAWHSGTRNQEPFRRAVTKFALLKECQDQIKLGYDACGYRFTQFPHRHFPGNMWIARCKYIKTLAPEANRPPASMCPSIDQRNFTYVKNGTKYNTGCRPSCTSFDRMFHEHWIGSNPYGNISDCLGYIKKGEEFETYWAQYGLDDWERFPVECGAAPKKVLVDAWFQNMSLIRGVDPWQPEMLASQRSCWKTSIETDLMLFGATHN